jgi:hypothetical protein
MKTVSYWMTPLGRHEVPEAILWLAEKAEFKATGRHMWRSALPQACFPDEMNSVYYKVIAEWGAWREQQDRALYEAESA